MLAAAAGYPDAEDAVKAALFSHGGARYRRRGNGHDPDPPEVKIVDLVCAADLPIEATDWLWEGHLARGALELLTGLPGLGKSQAQVGLIACVTNKLPWPNGDAATHQGKVIILTAEDSLSQTLTPRLVAAKADLSQVHILRCIKTDDKQRQFLLAEDLDAVDAAIQRVGNVALVTIDPITAYMGGKVDSHKTTEVRSQLGPLKDFAERTRVAVAAITHPPKGGSQKAIDQFIGSQAFIAAARIGHQCVPEMKDDGEGVMKPTGRVYFTNVKPGPQHVRMPTLAYRIDSAIVAQDKNTHKAITSPFVVWELEGVDITPDQALAAATGSVSPRAVNQRRVQQFLSDMLIKGPVDAKVVEAAAARRGITINQLRTARGKLGVIPRQKSEGGWEWLFARDQQGEFDRDEGF